MTYRSQALRFKYLVEKVDISDKSILDVGCGMGDLLPFLYAKADDFQYQGVDINPNFIEIAKKRYSGHQFDVIDPFAVDLKRKFDVVLTSGVMNHNVPGWLELRKQMIRRLFDMADEVLAFNMAGADHEIPDTPQIAYALIPQIIDFCNTLSPKVELTAGYNPKDFAVTMYK
jgi:SAM-dependent methyltransferase